MHISTRQRQANIRLDFNIVYPRKLHTICTNGALRWTDSPTRTLFIGTNSDGTTKDISDDLANLT